MEECHRRVGRVGPAEYQSGRRGRGEQCRPLRVRRRVGTMGACPPPRATSRSQASAVVAQNAAMYLFGQTIELYVDFDLTAAWRPQSRLHAAVKSEPVSGDHSAQNTERYMASSFQSQAIARNPTVVDRRCCTSYRMQYPLSCGGSRAHTGAAPLKIAHTQEPARDLTPFLFPLL